jgi:hypothetical protein
MKRFLSGIRFSLAGIVFILATALSFAFLTQQNQNIQSTLDGRELTKFEFPTTATFLDKSWMKQTESYIDDRFPGRGLLLMIHAEIATALFGSDEISGVWIDRKTGMLQEDIPVLAPIDRLDTGLSSLETVAREKKVPLLFVYVPKKQEVFADLLPSIWKNVYLENKPKVLTEFSKHGPVLDLTATVGNKETRSQNWFLTDHHWKPAGAIAASNAVRSQLLSMGLPTPQALPSLDISQNYPDFIGSTGRRVTSAGVRVQDEFTVPWSSKIGLTHCMNRSISDSSCSDPIFDTEKAMNPDVYTNRYETFLGGDNGIDDLRGNGVGTYIVLKDSFGASFVPYFAAGAKRVVAIDERYYKGESLEKLISEVKPDGLIFMHNQLTMSTFTGHEMDAWH